VSGANVQSMSLTVEEILSRNCSAACSKWQGKSVVKGNIDTGAVNHAVVLLAVVDRCKVLGVVEQLKQLSASGIPPNRDSFSWY
jgi:hypothetical protein